MWTILQGNIVHIFKIKAHQLLCEPFSIIDTTLFFMNHLVFNTPLDLHVIYKEYSNLIQLSFSQSYANCLKILAHIKQSFLASACVCCIWPLFKDFHFSLLLQGATSCKPFIMAIINTFIKDAMSLS